MDIFVEEPTLSEEINSWLICYDLNISPEEDHLCRYHYHDYIEILYGLDCDASAWIDGNVYPFKTGDMLLINCNEVHRVTHNKNSHYICLQVSPAILYPDKDAAFELKYVMPFLKQNNHQRLFSVDDLRGSFVGEKIKEIVTEYLGKDSAYELIIRANLLKVFAWIFRFWYGDGNMSAVAYSKPLKKAFTFISENYNTITAEQVAKHCGFSYNYFSYIFKEELGINFKDYVISLRLREAEKKLVSTDNSTTDIALSCGFSTSSYFITKFKEYKNMTPKKFREMIKK